MNKLKETKIDFPKILCFDLRRVKRMSWSQNATTFDNKMSENAKFLKRIIE